MFWKLLSVFWKSKTTTKISFNPLSVNDEYTRAENYPKYVNDEITRKIYFQS